MSGSWLGLGALLTCVLCEWIAGDSQIATSDQLFTPSYV